jgi:hypothetical protein
MNLVDICVAEGTHEEIKADPVKWAEQPKIGVQEDGEGGAYELRNCGRCRSTLALEVRS